MPLTRGRSDDWLPPSVGPVEAAAVEAVAARLGARCPGRQIGRASCRERV